MSRQTIPMQELKRRVIAEMDRHLGGRGTVIDLDIETLPPNGAGPTWGISAIRDESNLAALQQAVDAVVPKMQQLYDVTLE